MAKLRCSIVTPAESVMDAPVNYVTFEAWDGQRGVESGTSPFLVKLGVGAARIDLADGSSKRFAIEGGFAQMQGGALTLLADAATPAESIDLAAAERDLTAANAKVLAANEKPLSLEQREELERSQRWALSRAALAKTVRS